jgi:hypothetical protein
LPGAQLVGQRARLYQFSNLAMEMGDVRAAVQCEAGITSNLRLVAQLLGQLIQHHEVKSTSLLIWTLANFRGPETAISQAFPMLPRIFLRFWARPGPIKYPRAPRIRGHFVHFPVRKLAKVKLISPDYIPQNAPHPGRTFSPPKNIGAWKLPRRFANAYVSEVTPPAHDGHDRQQAPG